MDKYKLVIILGYFGLAVIASAAVVLIIILRPDATATIINYVGTIMAVASTGAVTFYMLGSQGRKIEEVKTLSNGTLSALRDENAQLHAQLLSVVSSAPSVPDSTA